MRLKNEWVNRKDMEDDGKDPDHPTKPPVR